MKTEEELMAAFEAGTLTEEEQDKFLVGESFDGETTKPVETAPPTVTTDEQKPEVVEPEAVVLAKDGKNTIPFKVVEDLREEVKVTKAEAIQLRQALDEQKGLLEQLTKAQEKDEAAGTTTATDSILATLEEDYPGITNVLQGIIDPVKAELAPLKAAREVEVKQTAEQQAAAAFDKSIADIEPRYLEAKDSDEFWGWFNSQSKLIRAAQNSGDPEVIAEVVKTYYDSQPTQASDTAKVAAKVKEAIENASSKSAVQTLSDIPGGQNPAADAMEAFSRLPESQQLTRMLNMDPDDIHKFLDKIV